jgi:hypothetical protein
MAIGTIITSVIGIVAKGKAAKAMAGGAAGLILTAGEPIVDAIGKGFATGAIPQFEQLGVILGQAIAGYLVGFVITWFAPANAPAKTAKN